MDMLKSVWILVHSILWPSMSYETPNTTESINSNTSLHFQVIGAGLSRTGTFSTRIALTSLLGGKCYHGYVASLDGEPDFWQRAANGVLSDEDWIKGLEGRGYTAGVGEPINLFYPELLRIFPHAKVILTTRPVEDWVRSMKKAIIEPRPYLERPPISWLFGLFGITKAKNSLAQVRETMAQKWGLEHNLWESVEAGDEAAKAYYEKWHAQVIANVPKDRLLIYNVAEGWEPLAKFLNVSTPINKPFPKINDGQTINVLVKGGYWILVLLVPIVFLLCTCKIRRRILERTFMKIMSCIKESREYYAYQPVIQTEHKV